MMRSLEIATVLLLVVVAPCAALAEGDGQALIEAALREEGYEEVKALLDEGANVETEDEQGMTALMWAVSKGGFETVEMLIEKGADVGATDVNGYTALFHGINHPDIVDILLAADADPNAEGAQGNTPLMSSLWTSGDEVTRLLLEAGADVDARNNRGETALMRVAGMGGNNGPDTSARIKLLLEHGANIEATDDNGMTVLLKAIVSWQPAGPSAAFFAGGAGAVAPLLAMGADPNRSGEGHYGLPLTIAVLNAGKETVKLLIDAGADVEGGDCSGRTPLMRAASRENKEIVNVLLKAGADVNAENREGYTALVAAVSSGETEMVEILKAAGAKQANGFGMTELMWAAADGDIERARSLLDSDANVEGRNGNGETALFLAARSGNIDMARLLIDGGADANARNDGCGVGSTLLMCSVGAPSDLVRLLLDSGADAKAERGSGVTALLFAASDGTAETIGMLLEAGADPNAWPEDMDHDNPLTRAVRRPDDGYEVVKLLLDAGADVNAKASNGKTILANMYGNGFPRGDPKLSQLLNDATTTAPHVDFDRSRHDANLLESIKVTGLDVSRRPQMSDSDRAFIQMTAYFRASGKNVWLEELKFELDDDQTDRLRKREVVELAPIVQEIPEDDAYALKEKLDAGDSITYRVMVSLPIENASGAGSGVMVMDFEGILNPTN